MANYNDALSEYSWAGIKNKFRSRAARRAKNNLGIIDLSDEKDKNLYRSEHLERLDQYYENRQYNHLQQWDEACAKSDDYVAVRQRKPRIIYPFAKNLAQRLTAKIVGESVFPKMLVKDFPDDQEFIASIIRESNLGFYLAEPVRRTVATGACFVRFWIVEGRYKMQHFKAKYCYPAFKENGELESMRVQYVFIDHSELDSKGDPKKKWFRLDLNENEEIAYNTPDYQRDVDPEVMFEEESRVDHGMGFVQGQYFRTDENSEDGCGFIQDICDFVDEFNYSLSQSSQAVSYNQEPQLVINGMDEEELGVLIRSSQKHWNLGREGKGEYLEAGLGGVERAAEMRDKIANNISDITRIAVLDPEKIVGNAQSAKAMEVLHGPLKDLVDELRGILGPQIKSLILKMAAATLIADRMGIVTPIVIPEGYVPQSMDITIKWPQLFQQTLEDLQKKVAIAVAASSGRLISEKTGTSFVAEDFGIEDVDAERAEILAQPPPPSPFGAF